MIGCKYYCDQGNSYPACYPNWMKSDWMARWREEHKTEEDSICDKFNVPADVELLIPEIKSPDEDDFDTILYTRDCVKDRRDAEFKARRRSTDYYAGFAHDYDTIAMDYGAYDAYGFDY